MSYKPYVIQEAGIASLAAAEYRGYLETNVLAAGIDLLLL